eukprot:gene22813-28984_t
MELHDVAKDIKTSSVVLRKEFESEKFINLIKKVLDNLTTSDPAVRLNGIKLLEIISEDQPRPFQSVLFVLFSIVQDFLQDSSRVLRNATLKLATNLATQLPFPVITKNVLSLLENDYSSNDYSVKIAAIALLNANLNAYNTDTTADMSWCASGASGSRISFGSSSYQTSIKTLIKHGLRCLAMANTQSKSVSNIDSSGSSSAAQNYDIITGEVQGSNRRHTQFNGSLHAAASENKNSPKNLKNNQDALCDLVAAGLLALKDAIIDCSIGVNERSHEDDTALSTAEYEPLLYDHGPDHIHCEVFYKNTLLSMKNADSALTVSMHIQKDIIRRVKSNAYPSLVNDTSTVSIVDQLVVRLKKYYQSRWAAVRVLKGDRSGVTGNGGGVKQSVPLTTYINTQGENTDTASLMSGSNSLRSLQVDPSQESSAGANITSNMKNSNSKSLLATFDSVATSSQLLHSKDTEAPFDFHASLNSSSGSTHSGYQPDSNNSSLGGSMPPSGMQRQNSNKSGLLHNVNNSNMSSSLNTNGINNDSNSQYQYKPTWSGPGSQGIDRQTSDQSTASNNSNSTGNEFTAQYQFSHSNSTSGKMSKNPSTVSLQPQFGEKTRGVNFSPSPRGGADDFDFNLPRETPINSNSSAGETGLDLSSYMFKQPSDSLYGSSDSLNGTHITIPDNLSASQQDMFTSTLDRSKLTGLLKGKSPHSQHRRTLSAQSDGGASVSSATSNQSVSTAPVNKTSRHHPSHSTDSNLSLDYSEPGGYSSSSQLHGMTSGATLCRTPPDSSSSGIGMQTPLKLMLTPQQGDYNSHFSDHEADSPTMRRDTSRDAMKRVSSRASFNTPHEKGKYNENGERTQELAINFAGMNTNASVEYVQPVETTYQRAASSRLKRSRLKSGGVMGSSVNSSVESQHNASTQNMSSYQLPSSQQMQSSYELSLLSKSNDPAQASSSYSGFHSQSRYNNSSSNSMYQDDHSASSYDSGSNRTRNASFDEAEESVGPYEHDQMQSNRGFSGATKRGQAARGAAGGNTIQHPSSQGMRPQQSQSQAEREYMEAFSSQSAQTDYDSSNRAPLAAYTSSSNTTSAPVRGAAGGGGGNKVLRSPRGAAVAAKQELKMHSSSFDDQQAEDYSNEYSKHNQNARKNANYTDIYNSSNNDNNSRNSNTNTNTNTSKNKFDSNNNSNNYNEQENPYADVASSGLTTKSENFEYIPSSDIPPSAAPSQDLAKALRHLEKQEWPEIFHTLNTVRKVAIHHPSVVVQSGGLHQLVLLIMKQVDNLRSSLAKNALITLGDLFCGLGRQMDPEATSLIVNLLKRSSDSSNFISESADAVLTLMVQHLSPLRCLLALTNHADHKNPITRAKVAQFLYLLVSTKYGDLNGTSKELDSLKIKLAKMLRDQTPECRLYSRHIVKMLLKQRLVGREELELTVPSDLIEKSLKDSAPLPSLVVSTPTTTSSNNLAGMARNESPYRTAMNNQSNNNMKQPNSRRQVVNELQTSDTDYSSGLNADGWSPAGSEYSSFNSTPANAALNSKGSNAAKGFRFEEQAINGAATGNPAKNGRVRQLANERYDDSNNSSNAPTPKSTNSAKPPRGGKDGASSATVSKRAMESEAELQVLPEILSATASKAWTERRDALTRLTEVVVKHASVLKGATKMGACLDAIVERLEDGNVKVITHVLSCIERISVEEPSVLHANLLQVVAPALLNSASSANRPIAQASIGLLQDLFKSQTALQTAQYLCRVSVHDKEKLRITAIKYVADNMSLFCADNETVAQVAKRLIFPTMCKVLFSSTTKGDARMAAIDCMKALQGQVRGERIWLWSDEAAQQEELRRITVG